MGRISKNIKPEEFSSRYWLKEELVEFCRSEGIPSSGSKTELTQRIERYLTDGTVTQPSKKIPKNDSEPSLNKKLGENFLCSQNKRMFFQSHLGKGFRFTVPFQNWIK